MRTLTTVEAETIYHIPAATFAQWCREGTLRASKVGGEWQMARIHPLQRAWWRTRHRWPGIG
jgi:hypothetical protein